MNTCISLIPKALFAIVVIGDIMWLMLVSTAKLDHFLKLVELLPAK